MTRMMADSVTSKDIPNTFPMIAGYDDGYYKWSPEDWQLHSGKLLVRITVNPADTIGDVLDVETGDATPAQAPAWVVARRKSGHPGPCVYMNSSTWPSVRAAFQNGNIPEPLYWVAQYDNKAVIPIGAIAKQYANSPLTGGHYDQSIVADYWPGVDQPEEPEMDACLQVTTPNAQDGIWILYQGAYWHASSEEPDLKNLFTALTAAKVPIQSVAISEAQHNEWKAAYRPTAGPSGSGTVSGTLTIS